MFSHIKPYRDEYLSALSNCHELRARVERQEKIETYLRVSNTRKLTCAQDVCMAIGFGSLVCSTLLGLVCVAFNVNSEWAGLSVIFALVCGVFFIVGTFVSDSSDSYRRETKRINAIVEDYNKFPEEPVLQQALLSALDDLEEKLKADLAQGILTREDVLKARSNKERAKVVKKYI